MKARISKNIKPAAYLKILATVALSVAVIIPLQLFSQNVQKEKMAVAPYGYNQMSLQADNLARQGNFPGKSDVTPVGNFSVLDKNWKGDGRFAKYTPGQEILSKRDGNSKHFRNADGSVTAIISSGLVHYKDQSGRWQDIRTDIRPNTSGMHSEYPLAVTENNYQLYFNRSLDDGYLMQFANGGIQLGMQGEVRVLSGDNQILKSVTRADVKGVAEDNNMKFNETYPFGYDVLSLNGMSIDHDVVLNEFPEILNNTPSGTMLAIREFISLPAGWKIILMKEYNSIGNDGQAQKEGLIIIDNDGKYVCEFLSPEIREMNKRILPADDPGKGEGEGSIVVSTTGSFRLEAANGGYYIETLVPVSWLKDSDRRYPVVIDPTITCYPTAAHPWTGWNVSATTCYGGLNVSGDYLYWVSNYSAGCTPSYYAPYNTKGFMYFNTSGIPDGATINSTVLNYNVYSKSTGVPYYNLRAMATYETACSNKWTYETTGAVYLDYTACSATGWYAHTLGTAANTDLQSRLTANYFGVAFDEYETVGCYWVRAYGWYTTSYSPYIIVDYTPPCAPPSNETCATATSIPTTPYNVTDSLGCTDDCTGSGYFDVFYKFTPSVTGSYTVDMGLSTGDTYLKVYAGSCCGAPIAYDDESYGDSDPSITLTLTGGTTYYFECGSFWSSGYANSAYNFNFVRNCTSPVNETMAGAINISFLQIAEGFDTTGLTGCTEDCADRPYHDVFYRYDCTCTGLYTFDMGNSDGDTYMRIFADSCGGALIAENDDSYGGLDPLITDTLTAGVTYWIECGSWSASDFMKGSAYHLHASTTCVPPCTSPVAETCSGAIFISPYSTPYSASGLLGCSDDCPGKPYYDVFYTFSPPFTGSYTINMAYSNGDTYLRIFSDSCCGTLIAEDDDSYGFLAPSITLTLTGGVQYFFECGSYGDVGYENSAYNLNLVRNCYAPVNETCAAAANISYAEMYNGFHTSRNLGCTDDCSGKAYHDVFYKYDCACTGTYTFDMRNSEGDTYMRIFSGSCCDTLLAENDDSYGDLDPSITVTMISGTSYWIECGSWSSNDYMKGTAYNLYASTSCIRPCTAPVNETCSAATYVLTTPYTSSGILGCTDDCPGGANFDVFYSFTPTVSGSYTVNMANSDGDTYLRVLSGSCCGTVVAADDDSYGGLDPSVTVDLTGGVTYYFECGSYLTYGYQNAAYNINLVRNCYYPANGTCYTAKEIAYIDILTGYSTSGKLGCSDDCYGRAYNDVFFKYVCTCTGIYTFDMRNSDGDTYMRIFNGSCCGTLVNQNDDGYGGLDPMISDTLFAGNTYWIECGSWINADYMVGSAFNLYISTTCVLPLGCGNEYKGSIHPSLCSPASVSYSAGYIPFWYFMATSGVTYHFTMGSDPEDSYLRIYDAAANLIAFQDDNGPFCSGIPSSISWTCAKSGIYFISASKFNCNNLINSGNLVFWSTNAPYSSNSGSAILPDTLWQYQPYVTDSVHWYNFTAVAGTAYDFSLCDNPEDSYLTIFDSSWGMVASADDDGPFCTGFPASHTWIAPASGKYRVALTSYNCDAFESSGNLAYRKHDIVPISCPSNATITENEPDCSTGYTDSINGGCNSSPEAYTELVSCNDIICGKSGTYTVSGTNYRDTDWYRLNLSGSTSVSLKAVADFPLQIMVLDMTTGCSGQLVLGSANATTGDTAYINTVFDGPGTLVYWIGPSVFSGVACGSNYIIYCNTVPVNAPGVPTIADVPTCGPTNLINNPDVGGVTNFWQGTSCGISTAYPASNPYPVSIQGTYYVRGRLNALECWTPCTSVNVVFGQMPVANAGHDTVYSTTPVQIGSPLSGPGLYSWSPADGLSNPDISQPLASPVMTTTYTLTVNNNGCIATDAVTVFYGTHAIKGKTRYIGKANAGNPVPNYPTYSHSIYNIDKVIVTLKTYPGGAEITSDTSDAFGNFQISNILDGNYILSYDKYTADTMQWSDDVNAIDIALIKYNIGADTNVDHSRNFSAKYKKAANVDNNATLNAVDVSRIKAKIGSPYSPAKNFLKGNWVAYDTLITIAGSDLNLTLKTLCYGDYNASSTKYRDSTVTWGLGKSIPRDFIYTTDDYITTSDPSAFELPLRISSKVSDLSAISMEMDYPASDYKLTGVIMPKAGSGIIKINPTLDEIIADNNDVLVTDEDGTIRLVYATTNFFDVDANDEIIRLAFKAIKEQNQGISTFRLNGTGVIGNQYGEEMEDAYMITPRIFVQSSDNEPGIDFTAYPNPFNNNATLTYTIPEAGTVRLLVYNAIGEKVAEILNENQSAGKHHVLFSPVDLPAGMYSFKLEFTGISVVKSLVIKMVH